MNLLLKRITVGTAYGGAGLLLLGFICYAAGARINTTKSIPPGVYWTATKAAAKGDYVLFCPPALPQFDVAKERGYIPAGFCPGDYGYMMKRVLAAKGDAIAVADDGVRVNGHLLPDSVLRKADRGGRPLPRYQDNNYTLTEQQVLLMADANPLSFDSRYFGPIQLSQIKTVIVPVFTW